MNKKYINIIVALAVIISVVIAFLFISKRINNSEETNPSETVNNTINSTITTTVKPTEQITEKATERAISEVTTRNTLDVTDDSFELIDFLGMNINDVFDLIGEDYSSTYNMEGGIFYIYKTLSCDIGKSLVYGEDDVATIFAYDDAHICDNIYADMTYNELVKVVPNIEEPHSDPTGFYHKEYFTQFEYENYILTYIWNDGVATNDTSASYVRISLKNE